MFAFLSPPEELSEVDSFLQAGGDLTRCVPNQLGKAFWQKTPTGPVEYLGHASAESQAEEEMFEGNLFLTVYLGVPEMLHLFFLLIPMPTAPYL